MVVSSSSSSTTMKTTKATTTTNTTAAAVDMSTKLGGRIFHPALPVVDASMPTTMELGFNTTLLNYCTQHIPQESVEGIQRRERVLNKMGAICREWITYVGVSQRGLPPDVAQTAGGQLFTSGSYRLGVHEPGADIDTILVAPSICRRSDFFGTTTQHPNSNPDDPQQQQQLRDPNSLAERIRRHPDVTNFVPVEGAAVPLLTFDWEGINIDLLFARLNSNSVPTDFDVDNDAVLDGADSATEKSLNGPRVTNLIAAFVGGTSQRYQSFLTVVRCVRKWAKCRGLYSNKMGYWGGVNINIGVALTVQLYPNACPAALLRKFFLVIKTWRWPQPLLLTKPHDAGYGLQVWSPQHSVRQVAPMITPAYPAMNSTLSVSRQTLQILQEEFNRAYDIVETLWKQYQTTKTAAQVELNWNRLFEPSDFFILYPAWAGFVESRLRKLVSDLLSRSLPLKKIQLWPKKIEACIADKAALLTQAQRQNCITYFIGFQIDPHRMRGDQLNVEIALQNFRDWDLSRFQPMVTGCDILVKHFRVKELPLICFESIYEGGKLTAMHKRRQMRNADPIRIEKQKRVKLEQLKAKMAEIQRKQEEQKDKKKKRKREADTEEDEENLQTTANEEDLDDEEATTKIKPKPGGDIENDDETDLLAHALDTIQEDVAGDKKTREEAEAEKEKLLAGELLLEEEGNEVAGYESDNEQAVGYTKDEARQVVLLQQQQEKPNNNKDDDNVDNNTTTTKYKDMRSLPIPDAVVETLRTLGYNIVSDDEAVILGADVSSHWNRGRRPAAAATTTTKPPPPSRLKIRFRQEFDLVKLDALGHVIDQGDDDFTPSKGWIGRKAGFEFKLGERGLGYYRTGKKVVVPSNTAY